MADINIDLSPVGRLVSDTVGPIFGARTRQEKADLIAGRLAHGVLGEVAPGLQREREAAKGDPRALEALAPYTDPKLAVQSLQDLGLDNDEFSTRVEQLQNILNFGSARTDLKSREAMVDRFEDDPRMLTPGYEESTRDLREILNPTWGPPEMGILPRGDVPGFVRQFGAVTAQEKAAAEDEKRFYDRQLAVANLEEKTWDDLGSPQVIAKKDKDGNFELDKVTGSPVVEIVQAQYNRIDGSRRSFSIGERLDDDSPQQNLVQYMRRKGADRFMSRANSIDRKAEISSTLAVTLKPLIVELNRQVNPGNTRGLFKSIALALHNGITTVNAFHKLTDETAWNRSIPNLIGGGSIISGISASDLGRQVSPEFMKKVATSGYTGITSMAQALSGTVRQQAQLTGQLLQIAVYIAQARSEGRLSLSATSARAATDSDVKRILNEMNQYADPRELAAYLGGHVQALLTLAQNDTAGFSYPDEIGPLMKQVGFGMLPRSPKDRIPKDIYNFYFNGQIQSGAWDIGRGEIEFLEFAPQGGAAAIDVTEDINRRMQEQ